MEFTIDPKTVVEPSGAPTYCQTASEKRDRLISYILEQEVVMLDALLSLDIFPEDLEERIANIDYWAIRNTKRINRAFNSLSTQQ